MELEQEIKQTKPFADPYQKAAVNLIYTHNWVRSRMQESFKSFGLTTKQFNIMRILKGAGKKVSTSYIRERMLEKNSDVSRIVDRMHEKNIVQKNGCPKDKRLVDVTLTQEGEDLLEEANQSLSSMNKIFGKLTLEEINLFNEILDRLRNK